MQVPVLLFKVHSTESRPGTVDCDDRTDAEAAAKPSVFSVVCIQNLQCDWTAEDCITQKGASAMNTLKQLPSPVSSLSSAYTTYNVDG